MTEPLVSIVIPHYNRPQLLEVAVDSVLASTYRNLEIIVVDDGSDDESRTAIDLLAAERVRIIDRKDGVKGPSRCRNIGVTESLGDFVIFLDSDDVMGAWCLEKRIAASRELPNADLWVFPVLLFVDFPGDRDTLWNRIVDDRDDAIRFAMSDPVWHTSSPLWRKDAFLRIGGFNEKVLYGDDTDLHLRALVAGIRIAKLDGALPDVFVRRSSVPRITSSLSAPMIESRRARLAEGSSFLKSANVPSDLMRAFEGQYFVEGEFLLFNDPQPKHAIAQLLAQWKRDLPEVQRHREIASRYLNISVAARDSAYVIVRIARRLAMLLLPSEYFPAGGTFSSEKASLPVMREVRRLLRNKSGLHRPHPIEKNDSQGWLGREPTLDEREVLTWIESAPLPERILHVGVGAALLTQRFGPRVVQGLTKDGGEVANAEKLGLNTVLCNKYDVRSYEELLSAPFDCIVDVNIRSYACCDEHFQEYMELMRRALSPGGVLLTSKRGLEYLNPISIEDLNELCPGWNVTSYGTVVAMRAQS